MRSRWVVLLMAVGASTLVSSVDAQSNPVHDFLAKAIGLSPAQIAAIERGEVVTRQLASTDKPEMAAFGAVMVQADQATFLARFRNLADFRRVPSVLEIGRLSVPPRVSDLAALTAEDGDLDALRKCRPGSCDVKLARSAMERLGREMNWSAPDAKERASTLLRQMLVDYASAYMKGGTPEMATYEDKEKALDTPTEFRKVLAASPYLFEYAPEFHGYVLDYPRGRLEGAEDLFYWAKDKFGPKPTVALYHVTLWKGADRAVIATKQIYASHYFQAGFDITALVGVPGKKAFYLIDLYRARVDPPTGLLSGVLLGKIRSGIEQGVAETLKSSKAKAEAQVR